ncbi:MAG: hypothetical protein M3552_17290 [Planctomycetota bacterium]|nr:hypothetical protein [Planctomycetota bacterium]
MRTCHLYIALIVVSLAPMVSEAQNRAQGCGYASLGCVEEADARACPSRPSRRSETCREEGEMVSVERVVPRERGSYAMPQAVGEQIGESGGLGIRGLELRVPEMKIALPELRLPSCFRIRHEAEMRVAEGRAPFVRGEAATYGQISPGGFNEEERAPIERERVYVERVPIERERVDIERSPRPCEQRPPCPPGCRQSQMPCDEITGEWASGAYFGNRADQFDQTYQASPYTIPPVPEPTREAAVPPPPAPPADPTVSELQELRQQLALQQQVIAQLQKSMELTQRGLDAAIAPAPAGGSPPASQRAAVAEMLASAPQHLAVAERSRGGIWPTSFQMLQSDGWIPQEDVPPVIRETGWSDE